MLIDSAETLSFFLAQRQGRDHGNPLKPSSSSRPPLKWSWLLFSLWSLALEASAGQPLCDHCHIDEAPSLRLVRDLPRLQPTSLHFRRRVKRLPLLESGVGWSKKDLLLMVGFKLLWEFFHIYNRDSFSCKQATRREREMFEWFDIMHIFLKCRNQYPP